MKLIFINIEFFRYELLEKVVIFNLNDQLIKVSITTHELSKYLFKAF